MLAFAHLPDPVLHAFTTRAIQELRRFITHPEIWSAVELDYWDNKFMELRAIYTDSAIKQASAALLKAHKDPATFWNLDLHHWLHLVIALGLGAKAHEPDTRLGPSRVDHIDIQPLLRRYIPEAMRVYPADIIRGEIVPDELLPPDEDTGDLKVDEEAQIGPDSLSITSLGPPPAVYLEALHLPMPAIIEIYPMPDARTA